MRKRCNRKNRPVALATWEVAMNGVSKLHPTEVKRLKDMYYKSWGTIMCSLDWNADDWNRLTQQLLLSIELAKGKFGRQIGVECIPEFDAALNVMVELANNPDLPTQGQIDVMQSALSFADTQLELATVNEFLGAINFLKRKVKSYQGCEIGEACQTLMKTRPGPETKAAAEVSKC